MYNLLTGDTRQFLTGAAIIISVYVLSFVTIFSTLWTVLS